jgi:hypothetical protein
VSESVLYDLFEPLVLEPDLVVALFSLMLMQMDARAIQALAAATDEIPIGRRDSPLELAGLPGGVVGDLIVGSSLLQRGLGFDHHLLV